MSSAKPTILLGFADDMTLVVFGESMEELELLAAHSISIVDERMWFTKLGLPHQ